MNLKKIKDLDFKLLAVFDAVFETQSVTVAGKRIGLSQPAMSYSLTRLRAVFGDPLFIRVDNCMRPTPRALELAPAVKRVMDVLQGELLGGAGFDPATSTRQFELCMSDIGELYFLPGLARGMWAQSPGSTLRTRSMAIGELVAKMEEGGVDLAVGYYPDLDKGGFYQQLLFESVFVCIASSDNRALDKGLSLQTYKSAPHVAVAYEGRSQEMIDRHLMQMKIERRVVLSVPHFLSLAEIVPQTDVIATVPREAALQLAKSGRIRVHDLPVAAPGFPLMQFWHKRNHADPASQWLRTVVRQAFQQ
ncbi:LysR family transcriptional regulator [Eoetvoesiella caeni]|uniref:LysR family transcriptional regulator n=1 Tax=Eoetvoesiella caeni TaxID=645616 RepID=A0A366H965_9BURK|nr:LysR family transcriptional regulator [Eoetvoesiella caeni]MCI2809803.1 LysR family transcriptional regulator [Eoetvoesiella caeni]NYT56282.1 LysR family transcriptional regulator [Eoetvoesiella caeni]RBP38340.1 LysR family transcriptional regulator [Eoetvoesiella caeni]